MKITAKTRTKDILPLLTEERIKKFAADVPPVPLEKPLLSMTCGEFIEAMDEKFALRLLAEKRALTAFGRYRQYLKELEGITAYLGRYEVPQSADEKAAASGVRFPSMQERILLDCVRFYHLHSTAEAEALPIADWLLVVKSEGSAAQYQHRLNEQQKQKQQSHARH